MRYSAEEIRHRIAQGDDKTDWARVDALAEKHADDAGDDDSDWAELTSIDWTDAKVVYPVTKAAISIRLDSDVVDFFKSSGKGYQGRINAVLRHFMTAQKKDKKAG